MPATVRRGVRFFCLIAAALFLVLGCGSSSSGALFAGDGPDGGDGSGGNPQSGGGSNGTCTPATCASANKNCGRMLDGCGGTVTCGDCGPGLTCGAGGPNVCGPGTCAPTTCAQEGANCGKISDGCASVLECGTCGIGK